MNKDINKSIISDIETIKRASNNQLFGKAPIHSKNWVQNRINNFFETILKYLYLEDSMKDYTSNIDIAI